MINDYFWTGDQSQLVMRIFLIGYMGSGKSKLAEALSKELSYDLIDTDNLVETQTGQTVSQVFDTKGEDCFRNLESKILSGLAGRDNIVVATGGGLPCFNNNVNTINKFGTSFYLYHKTQNLADRLILEKEDRPLIQKYEDKSALHSFIKIHLEQREKYYFQANFILNGNQTIDSLVDDVLWFKNQLSQ